MVNPLLTTTDSPYAVEQGRQNGRRRETGMSWVDWVRALAALAATLGLLAGAAYLARRMGMLQAPAAGGKRRMSVVESLFLDPRRRVVIVRVDGEEHVMLLSPFGDRPIASRAAPASADTAAPDISAPNAGASAVAGGPA